MDYRKFLGREEELVLPYFGGMFVEAKDRRLRLASAFEPVGWYRFTVKGRVAAPKDKCDPPPLDDLPTVRGNFLSGRMVREGSIAEEVFFLPEEPARFAPLKARRWHSGELVFDTAEFESDVESAVREALADNRPLEAVKGVGATLRAAYAYALLEQTSRRLNIPFAPHEVRPSLSDVATRGTPAAEAELHRLHAEREQSRREMEELRRQQAARVAAEEMRTQRERRVEEARTARRDDPAKWRELVHERAELTLQAAGARLEQSRLTQGGQLEVIFRFEGQRFISIVDAATFRVIDSGICLGHPPSDNLITLDSLPSVIKEAIDDEALVILRHP